MNYWLVFLEGVVSFLSPCVLPLLPVFISVLSSSSTSRAKLFMNSIGFIAGISSTFFLLGNSMTALSSVFTTNRLLIEVVGGLFIILMGLFYMGVLQIPFLQREKKFHYEVKQMSILSAFILGLTFSFGWTPCIGPMLASILVMASMSGDFVQSNGLILLYTLGFIIPFFLLTIFYQFLLPLFDKLTKHIGVIQKIGGILLVVSGLVMMLGGLQVEPSVIGQTATEQGNAEVGNEASQGTDQAAKEQATEEGNGQQSAEKEKIPAPDFELVDQSGNIRKLSDYKGQVVFLNFWATWCPPCKEEMPDIEKLYQEYGQNEEDLVVLGVAAPLRGQEGSIEDITAFLEDGGYTFPVVFDETGQVLNTYAIQAYPTTFIINKEGNVEGYLPGAMNLETMEKLIAPYLE